MLFEELQYAEDGGAVDGEQTTFHVLQREGLVTVLLHGFEEKQTVGRRAYAMLCKFCCEKMLVFHCSVRFT